MKKDIKNIDFEEILKFCNHNFIPKYRATQIWEWLWKKGALNFQQMTSLPLKIRNLLANYFCINNCIIHKFEKSLDETIKYSFKLHDNLLVEGVLIPTKKRITACISSQVGCSLTCNFCATGTLKLKRNLTYGEIYDQVFLLNNESIRLHGRPLSNIVYMGMGEPLLNYSSLLNSIQLITSDSGLAMSPKRITVSTSGITKMIKRLADENVKFNLAISLHSANDIKRSELMPINIKLNLENLKESIIYFQKKTGTRITYEYILFKNVNDSPEDAKELVEFIKGTFVKINLIEYNNVDGLNYEKSSNSQTNKFISLLESEKIIVNLRRSKGKDIAAACGQLVNKLQ